MAAPLEDIRVLDLTRNVAGPYATKLLADYGADVLKLEPPDGDPARRFGPFPGNVEDPEASGLFLHLNTNKRSATVDPATAEGAATIRSLAAECDVVIEDHDAGRAAAWGWGWDELSRDRDDLVMLSLTPFGQDGPYRDYLASEITLQAMGGPLLLTGHRSREPLKFAGHVAHYSAGGTAALAILLARYRVEAGGAGDYIDLAVYECQAGFRDRRAVDLTGAAYAGVTMRRRTGGQLPASGIRPALDGYINLHGFGARLPGFLALIGREDLITREELFQPVAYVPDELIEELEASYAEFLQRTPKIEALRQAQEFGILGGALLTIGEVLQNPHFRGRGAWDTIDHPRTGPLEYPGRPFIMNASPRRSPRRAPLLGEHDAALTAPSAWPARPPHDVARRRVAPRSPRPSPTPRPAADGGLLRPPLEGVRVAAATVVWAGPYSTQLLAEWGAEVIRVESVNRIHPNTRGAEVALTKEQCEEQVRAGANLAALYPDLDPKDDPWNRSANFNSHARNKKSMTADLSAPEGREAFLRLVEVSDVVIENNSPGAFDRARLTWDDLREVNPRLVMVRMPAFGLSGPYHDYRCFGTHAEAMAGQTLLRRYIDGEPQLSGDVLSADAMAGVHGAVAAMMGLRHRQRTGEGQLIELPLAEGFIPTLGEFILDYVMNGYEATAQGNTHRWHAPHGVYPTGGEDQWIAIDVATDEQFASLCAVLGSPGLAGDPRYASAGSRREHRAALEASIGELTAARDKEALFHELQAAGVCAAPLRDALEILADPQLNARNWFREIHMPTVGTHRYPGYLFKMRNTSDEVRLPPPRLGEHNEEVYLDLLGYSREDYEALVERGLVGTRYPAEILTG